MKVDLYFEHRDGSLTLLAEDIYQTDIWAHIKEFCDDYNFHIDYVRYWNTEDHMTTVYDVGSHTEFFLAKKRSGK